MNKLRRFYGIILAIVWILINRIVVMPYFEIGDFRFHLFLGIILGLSCNTIEYNAKHIRIASATITYILIAFLFDWYFYINDKIILSPHGFFNLLVTGFISFESFISHTSKFFLSINMHAFTVYITSIIVLIATSFIDYKKIAALLDFSILFPKDNILKGFISLLSALIVWSVVFTIYSVLNEISFYESLSETQTNVLTEPKGFSLLLFINILLFSFISVFSLFLLSRKTRLKNGIIVLLFFVISFLSNYAYELVAGGLTKFSYQFLFDNSLLITMKVLFITITLLKYKPFIAFVISIHSIWLLNIIYQSFLFAPEYILNSIITELLTIYIPLSASFAVSIVFITINRFWVRNDN